MTLELKDVLYFLTVGATFAMMWFRIGGKVASMEQSVSTFKKIIFKANGELALVTPEQCRERQAVLQRAQEKSDAAYQRIETELRELSSNVLIIMVHLNIDTDAAKKRGVKNG